MTLRHSEFAATTGPSRRPVRRLQPQMAGFTLVEMLLVLMIMSIFAGAAVVSFVGREDGHALATAAKDLAGAIRFGTIQARTSGARYRLAFLDELTGYRIEMIPSAGESYVPAEGLAGQPRKLPAGVHITDIKPPVAGNGPATLDLGGGSSSYSGLIELQGRAGKIIRVEVLAETGQVNVLE